jgi:hypothetical protein
VAYDFLGLVNDINRKLNEVELTSSNFSSAKGFYSHAKDAVNAAIQDINHDLETETLVAGTSRYNYPADAKTIDFDSFRIRRSTAFNNETVKLKILSYEEYLEKFVDQEYNTSTSLRDLPSFIVQAPNRQFILVQTPKEAYQLTYEYYKVTTDLSAYNDVSVIPEMYRHVIVEGATYYAYMFRGNTQDAAVAKAKFEQNLKHMRIMLVNRTEYVRSTMLPQNKRYTAGFRVN